MARMNMTDDNATHHPSRIADACGVMAQWPWMAQLTLARLPQLSSSLIASAEESGHPKEGQA